MLESLSNAAMIELGNQLARRRTRLQKSLEICAADLGFRCRYLESVESGQINLIPWPSLSREIVREYASYLGLSGEKIARYYFYGRGENKCTITQFGRTEFPMR